MLKIVSHIFWFMFGGVFTTLLVNDQVISKNQGNSITEAEKAIYNLHDELLDFVVFFIGATLVCLFLYIAMKKKAKLQNT